MARQWSKRSLGALIIGAMLVGAAADRAISRLDVQAMSDAEKNKQVRKDLLSILLPSQSLYASRSLSLDGDVWLHTRASATPYKTLCQRDTLSLFYKTIEDTGRYQERPALPYKLETSRSYRFVGTPRPEYMAEAEEAEEPRSPFVGECRKADNTDPKEEWTGWIQADSPEMAMEGGFAMLALKEWAGVDANQYANCVSEKDPKACKEQVSYALNLDSISGVGSCEADAPDRICLVLGRFSTLFMIQARKTDKPMQAADILSVDYEIQIIVT